jgi:hypothetical protein
MPDSRRRLYDALLALKHHEALRIAAALPTVVNAGKLTLGDELEAVLRAPPEDQNSLWPVYDAVRRREAILLELLRQIQPAWKAVLEAANSVDHDCLELRIALRLKTVKSWPEVVEWLVPLPAEFVDELPVDEPSVRDRLEEVLPAQNGFNRSEIHGLVGGYRSKSGINQHLTAFLPAEFEDATRRNRKFPRELVIDFLVGLRRVSPIEILDGPKPDSRPQES